MDDGVIQEFLVDGKELFELGYYEELRNLCKDFLDKVKDERIYALLTVAEYTLEDYAAAEDAARKGMALNSSDPDILFNLACIMKVTGRYSNAWRFFNRAEKYADEDLKTACKEEMSAIEEYLGVTSAVLCPPKQNKRVLIIAAIYPPESGSGVQRTLKLVKYLRLYGWEPVVVTYPATENPTFSGLNYFDELPDDIEVIRIPSKSSISMADIEMIKDRLMPMLSDKTRKEFKLIYSRLNINQKYELCSFPDKSIYWAYEVADHIEQYVDMSAIDLVYSTSGPYSDHFAGYYVKERFQKPWVVDFRDEWSNNPAIWPDKDNVFYRMCVDCERKILNTADQVIAISETAYENYIKIGISKNKLTPITNGYDEEDFEAIDVNKSSVDRFTLIHNGLLYLNRIPFAVFEAIKNLIQNGKIERNKIIFHLGNFTNSNEREIVSQKIAELEIKDCVSITPYMEHLQSLSFTSTANVLVLLMGNGEQKAGLTGKIFEYLRFGKPVICFGSKDSLGAKILKETGCGETIAYDDVKEIEIKIFEHYQDWLAAKKEAVKISPQIMAYERKILTISHVEIFERANKLVRIVTSTDKIFPPAKDKVYDLIYSNNLNDAFRHIIDNVTAQNYEKASRYIEALLNVYSNRGEIYLYYGICMNALGKFDEALKAHKKAIDLTPSLSNIKSGIDIKELPVYDEINSDCIGCGSKDSFVVWVCNQSIVGKNYGVLNPIRIWKQCKDCGLVFASNLPSGTALSKYYYYSGVEIEAGKGNFSISEAGDTDGYLRYSKNRLERIESIVGKKGSILDIGAGRGTFVHVATERGWNALGIESSPGDCAYAKNNFGVEHINVDFFDYYTTEKHNAITMFEVIEHLVSPWKAIAKCADLLAKGGVLVIATPFRDSKFVKSRSSAQDFWWCEPAHLSYMDTQCLIKRSVLYGLDCVNIVDADQGAGRLEVFFKKR